MVHGNREQLQNPQYNQYNLFGKKIRFKEASEGYEIKGSDYQILLMDLKKQFNPYIQIFELKNAMSIMNETIVNWSEILLKKNQIILQGPPGTGKTYSAQDIAYYLIFDKQLSSDSKTRKNELLELESNDQYKFIQFHPAYTYEDFVRGITAKTNGSSIEYKAENKLLGQFAKDANQNFADSKKSLEDISLERWVYDKTLGFQDYLDSYLPQNGNRLQLTNKVYVNRTDENGIRYKRESSNSDEGVPFNDLIEMYLENAKTRKEVKAISTLSSTAKHRSTYWLKIFEKFKEYIDDLKETPPMLSEAISEKKFVLVIDEINRANLPAVLGELIYALEYRDHNVQSMYQLAVGGNSLVLPSNLFIIGTMNTADRSVGHIDYAIRRRFAFVSVLPNTDVITYEPAKLLFAEIKKFIADHLASDFEVDDIMLGHSYFMVDNDADLKMKLRYEVYPILKEYLKDGILNKNKACEDELKSLLEKIDKIGE